MSKRKATHYLLTLDFFSTFHFHCYLMCTEDREQWIDVARTRLVETAENILKRDVPMIILQTELTTGSEIVRDHLRRTMDDTTNLDNAKKHHLCIWLMPVDHPDDAKLMELH